jgi:hypothetical protein
MRLLMLGLDAAGKTSQSMFFPAHPIVKASTHPAILYKLKLNQSVTTIPTGSFTRTHYETRRMTRFLQWVSM